MQVLDSSGTLRNLGQMTDVDSSLILIHSSETKKGCYRYVGSASPPATPTDWIVVKGSVSMTLRIKRIVLGGIATTAGSMPVVLIKRSTGPTGGTPVTVVAGEHDNNDATATAAVTRYTANPASLGTLISNVGQGRLWLPLATGQPFPLVWEFATRQDKALILRGASDYLCVNLGGAAVPAGGVIDFELEIEEDNS